MKLLNNFYIIKTYEKVNDNHKYLIRLNESHPIYSCHFPGNPITPGVCILQILTELCEDAFGKSQDIKSYVNVKYLSVISPNENPDIVVEFGATETSKGIKVKAVVYNDKVSFAKISAIYA